MGSFFSEGRVMDREEIVKAIDGLEKRLEVLDLELDKIDGPFSFFERVKRSLIRRYWSFDGRLFRSGSDLYFTVYFCSAFILFLDFVSYVLLPVVAFLLSFLATGIGGL
jgi:hypothetical protein